MPHNLEINLAEMIDKISRSKKYRGMEIPETTIRNLFELELAHTKNLKDADEAVRFKLHNLMAPYLGDPDYDQENINLSRAFETGGALGMKTVCDRILRSHASTRERIPHLEQFYQVIFSKLGIPEIILDLACGLNPFAFPWMGLPNTTQYHAYDIHQPRVRLINHYFSLEGLSPLAEVRDVLIDPPAIEADMAILFKEAHRMEQRQKGSTYSLLKQLRAKTIIVSLPASSLSGKFDLAERQRQLIKQTTNAESWRIEEALVGNEMLFFVRKT